LSRAVGKELELTHLEDFIEGKLNGAERDLSQDEREVAIVESADTFMLHNIDCALPHAFVLAYL